MFDISNKGADKFQVFYILFNQKPVMNIKTDTICILLKKKFSMFSNVLNRIYLK